VRPRRLPRLQRRLRTRPQRRIPLRRGRRRPRSRCDQDRRRRRRRARRRGRPDTIDGRTVITPSNKVCIYAPRFAAIREVVDLRALARIDAAHGEIAALGPQKIRERDEAASSLAALKPNIDRAKTPPSLLRERQQPGELDRDRRVAVTPARWRTATFKSCAPANSSAATS
jgi:hypothetical protein